MIFQLDRGLGEQSTRRVQPAPHLGHFRVVEYQQKQIQAIFNDASLNQEQKRAKVGPIMQAGRDKIKKLLTPDQQKKYDTMMQNMRRGNAS